MPRAAAVQIHARVHAAIVSSSVRVRLKPCSLFPDTFASVKRKVGPCRIGRCAGTTIPTKPSSMARWAAESAKRYLAATIAVGTVDQAMLAGLQVKHAHLRSSALSRSCW